MLQWEGLAGGFESPFCWEEKQHQKKSISDSFIRIARCIRPDGFASIQRGDKIIRMVGGGLNGKQTVSLD